MDHKIVPLDSGFLLAMMYYVIVMKRKMGGGGGKVGGVEEYRGVGV